LKDLGRRADLDHSQTAARLRHGPGPATLFRDVVASLAGGATWRIRYLAAQRGDA